MEIMEGIYINCKLSFYFEVVFKIKRNKKKNPIHQNTLFLIYLHCAHHIRLHKQIREWWF